MPAILIHFAGSQSGQLEFNNVELNDYFPFLPLDGDGEQMWPDFFSGLLVRRVGSFHWTDNESQHIPFPNEGDLLDMEGGQSFYLGGLRFFGPLSTSTGAPLWNFPFPLTADNITPFDGATLVLELDPPENAHMVLPIEFLDAEGHQMNLEDMFTPERWGEIANLEEWQEEMCAIYQLCPEDDPPSPPLPANSQVGISLAINIFDEFFTELHRNDENLQNFSINFVPGLDLGITGLGFLYDEGLESTLLRINGVLPDVELVIDLDLSLVLKFIENNPPVLGLSYNDVHNIEITVVEEGGETLQTIFENNRDAIIAEIGDIFNNDEPGSIGSRINEVQIDLVAKAIEGLEVIMFPDEDDRPDRSAWQSQLELLPAQDDAMMDSVAIFIAAPVEGAVGLDLNFINTNASFLKSNTGFELVFNKDFLQDLFDLGATESIGTEKCGATLEELTLTLDNEQINIVGSVSRSIFTIPFEGPGFPFLYRGTTQMSIDTGQVGAEEPSGFLGGFLKFLGILTAVIIPFIGTAIFGLIGLIGGIVADIWIVPAFWGAAEDLENAENAIQGGLAGALGAQLSELSSGLNIEEDIEMVTLESTPNQLGFIDGHYCFDALVFVSPIEEAIVNGWYSTKNSRFEFFELEGGQIFKASELARLVKSGKISTPGFHAVRHFNGRLYMRANRDNEAANNLFQTFRNNPPPEHERFLVTRRGDSDGC